MTHGYSVVVPMQTRSFLTLALAVTVLGFALPAAASERRFAYTYESNVLNPGDLELEPWSTWRFGREHFYSRFDQRLEFEVGLVPNLQTALYWNFKAVAEDVDDGAGGLARQQEFEFEGISNEWKYKLSDNLADAIGSALYFEWRAAPAEAEVEAKVILDKRAGDLLVAFNAVGEHEWAFPAKGKSERELELAAHVGAGYFITSNFVAGAEVRAVSEFKGGKEYEGTTLFAGPTLAFAQEKWWTALAFQPQLFFIAGEEEEGGEEGHLNLEDHERMEVRLLVGMDL